MKEVVLPPNFPKPRPSSKIVSARVMEYMIDYFYEEVYGEDA